ncbi:MAG: hypothetical protein IJG64_02135 [Oscillospiraceae bacterium]|nr:hypothetical protein [Oscillospiraceae bacterium]
MKKLAALMLLSLILVFAGCSEEEQRYSINIISSDYSCIFDYYTIHAAPGTGSEEESEEDLPEEPEEAREPAEGDTEEAPAEGEDIPEEEPREPVSPYELTFVSESEAFVMDEGINRTLYLDSDSLKVLDSVTVCDNNMTDEAVSELIEKCSKHDIPLFIMGYRPSREVMDSYDKIFWIGADYTYLGQAFGDIVNENWTQAILDKNEDQIFQFTTIRSSTVTVLQDEFYNSFVKYIELVGIPLQELSYSEVTPEELVPSFNASYAKTECYIMLDNGYMETICREFEGDPEHILLIGIVNDVTNPFTEYPFAKVCFFDYKEMFTAKARIMENIASTVYPLKDIGYDVIGRYVYIEPEF